MTPSEDPAASEAPTPASADLAVPDAQLQAAATAPDGDAIEATEATAAVAEAETAVEVEAPAPDPITTPTVAPRARRRRRALAFRFGFAFLLGVALAVGIGAGGLYVWGAQYDGRILPGVHVGTTDLSGLTRDQAKTAIAEAYAGLGTGKVILVWPDGQTTVSFADLGRGPDTAAMLDAALAVGRQGEPLAEVVGAPRAAIRGVAVTSAVTYDRARLTAAVDALAAAVDRPAVDAAVSVGQGGSFTVVPATTGRTVDRSALLAAIDAKLTSLDAPAEIRFDVPTTPLAPSVPSSDAYAAQTIAFRMAADIVLTRNSERWTIPSAKLVPLISFVAGADGNITPVFDQGGLDPILKGLAKQINQNAKAAGLKLVRYHVVATGVSQEGRVLDVRGTSAAIAGLMAARQAGTATGSAAAAVAAVIDATDPALSKAQANAFAAKMIPISSFSVYYWVIINNHWGGNIEAPATKINGTVVPAGGVFDFWKVVGDLHKLPGTGPGNAIEGGKITVTGAFGGGICTTSTTLFNAAIHAGMVPIARQAHNEFINRYPAGLDATVWIVGNTKQTMSFRNDTAYPILIQRVITYQGSKRWLTFKIWSVPNGRTTTITNTVIRNGPRAIDTIVKDPTKPVGYRFRNNAPADGAKVWVTVTIYDHGKLHWTKRFYSNYPAVNGVLVVGTKGAPTPSPTPSPSPSPSP